MPFSVLTVVLSVSVLISQRGVDKKFSFFWKDEEEKFSLEDYFQIFIARRRCSRLHHSMLAQVFLSLVAQTSRFQSFMLLLTMIQTFIALSFVVLESQIFLSLKSLQPVHFLSRMR